MEKINPQEYKIMSKRNKPKILFEDYNYNLKIVLRKVILEMCQ